MKNKIPAIAFLSFRAVFALFFACVVAAAGALSASASTAPAFTSGNSVIFPQGYDGSFTITTTGSPTPRITQTGHLPGGVKFVDNGDGTASLTGRPGNGVGQVGNYSLTFTATNGINPPATQSFTLTVTRPPLITSVNNATFVVGVSSSFTVATRNSNPKATLSYTGTLPAGVTFNANTNGTATLSGKPAAGSEGVYPLIITASSGTPPNSVQHFTLTVQDVPPTPVAPKITTANNVTFTADVEGTFTIRTTGTPTASLTTSGTLPSWLSFMDNTDGTATLVGVPDPAGASSYTFTITASNGVSPAASQTFTLNVYSPPPVITTVNNATFVIGALNSFTFHTTPSFPFAVLTLSGALPTGVTFVSNGDGSATLSGTPAAGTQGTYHFTVTAANGTLPNDSLSFTLTVQDVPPVPQAPTITSPANATFTRGSPGTFTITTTGTPTARLALSGAMPNWLSYVDNNDGTATLSGTPASDSDASYAFTVTASNGVSPAATQMLTVNVFSPPPVFTSADNATFLVGTSNSFTVSTSSVPTATLSYSGVLPPGVTFTSNANGTATLSGTPAAGSEGVYQVTITATNGFLPDSSQSFTLTIQDAPPVPQAPAIISTPNTTFTIGAQGTYTITTTGVPTPNLTVSGSIPSWLTFTDNNDGTATLSGTPTLGSASNYSFTVNASNGVSPAAHQAFTLNVAPPPPVFTSIGNATFEVGTFNSFTVGTQASIPAASLSLAGNLPAGVQFIDNGDGSASLSGTPVAGSEGVYQVTITAANGTLPNTSQSFSLTVQDASPTQIAPTITSSTSTSFTRNVQGSFTITASGTPTPQLSLSASSLPSWLTFVDNGDGTGTLSGTPDTSSASSYSFTITASNGVLPAATQTFTLGITSPPATFNNVDNAVFVVGSANTFTVTTSSTPTAALTFSGNLPNGVTFVDNGDGTATISGTPAAGSEGTYNFNITASNGSVPNGVQSFTLTVQDAPPVQQAPAITSAGSATFTRGTPGSVTITATGTPTPQFSVSGNLPAGVTFSDNNDGTASLSGTPDFSGASSYTFTITADNGVAPAAAQTFTLNLVSPAPSFGSVNNASFVVGVPNSFVITTGASVPPATLTSTGSLPAGVSFVDNGNGSATLSGTPAAGSEGTYQLTINASNGTQPDASQSFTLTVQDAPPVQQAPVITSAAKVTFANSTRGSFTVTTTGTPTPQLTVAGTLPSWLTFVDNNDGTATLTGTPNLTTAASYSFVVTASNGVVPDATQQFTLSISTPTPITKLTNISTRLKVLTGDSVGIGGFIINGTAPKKVIIRGLGPSLSRYGVAGALQNPKLELHNGTGAVVASNDNWASNQQAAIRASGYAPADPREAAILITLQPGSYTVALSGSGATTGIGLLEVYDLDPTANATLGNISTRGQVQTGDSAMIGGFILGGSAPSKVVVRALGPSLTAFGIHNALSDPTLKIYNAQGVLLGANDNWRDTQQAAIQSTHLQPPNNLDSAIVATLPVAGYTAVVAGRSGVTGVSLVEVYSVP